MTDYLIHVKKQGLVGYWVTIQWQYGRKAISTFVESRGKIKEAIDKLFNEMEEENV